MKKSLLHIYLVVLSLIFINIITFTTAHAENNGMEQNKFREIDTNSDSQISADELADHEKQRGKSGGNRFSQTDTNGDGIISMDEFLDHEANRGDKEGQQRQQPTTETPNDMEDRQPPNQNPSQNTMDGQRSSGKQSKYSLDQAISDKAQLNTIAFNGLAFLTGDFGAATFIPPGKICDFFGFQYMRDIDAAQKGHNPMFLDRVAGNILYILNDNQKKMFMDIAKVQAPKMEELAKMRLDLIKAFHLQRDQEFPSTSSGLNKEAVTQKVGDIFAMDAELSLKRAEIMAAVALSLTYEQKEYLSNMKFGDFNTWPIKDERGQLKHGAKGQSKMVNVAYMTYASEFFSWIAGSEQADVYFCPERHGTYFGGFYMKDMPAMGKRDYDISTSVTGNSGESFLGILNSDQRQHITRILDLQADELIKIISIRHAISRELRKYLVGQIPDKERIMALGREYGELDGYMSYLYTIAFSNVNKTLSSDQHQKLVTLRSLDGYKSADYYIYSQAINTSPDMSSDQILTDIFF